MSKSVTPVIAKAWNELVMDAQSGLAELLAKKVRALGGDLNYAEAAQLLAYSIGLVTSVSTVNRKIGEGNVYLTTGFHNGMSFSKPKGFKFNGVVYRADNWRALVHEFSVQVFLDNLRTFARALRIQGKRGGCAGRSYFQKAEVAVELQDGRAVADSGIYVETCLSANNAMQLCRCVHTHFGYPGEFEAIV
jgi:hypothetical protein